MSEFEQFAVYVNGYIVLPQYLCPYTTCSASSSMPRACMTFRTYMYIVCEHELTTVLTCPTDTLRLLVLVMRRILIPVDHLMPGMGGESALAGRQTAA